MHSLSFEKLVNEKFDSLSPGKKRVAEYLVKNVEKASYSTIMEIQSKAQVGETTVIRLAYALGFTGFSEMQKYIQNQILNGNKYQSQNDLENISNDNNTYYKIAEEDTKIIKESVANIDWKQFESAVESINKASKVLIIGNHTAYAAASWFSLTLGLLRDNVRLIEDRNEYEELLGINNETVVLAISFPRYRKKTFNFLEKAKKQQANIISLTDNSLSPISRVSNISLFTNTNRDVTGYNSIAPVLSFLNLLIVGVREKLHKQINSRLSKLEEFYQMDDTVFE